MTSRVDLNPACELIARFNNILIVSHSNPDADAYGSSCGLAFGLEAAGKKVAVFNESGRVEKYSAIPGVPAIESDLPEEIPEDVLLIVCDCGAAERVGERFVSRVVGAKNTLNIDHHVANSMFGSVNLVDERASSTSEIVYNLLVAYAERLKLYNFALPLTAAKALLTGIIGDTGSFRYPSTSPETFLVAHELTKLGAHPSEIVQGLFANTSLPALKLQTESLNKIALFFEGQFAEVVVSAEMITRLGADILDADSLAERARDVSGVKVAALFKQDGDVWRVSLRSRNDRWDVSTIARSFGGGGHKAAAAFRWRKDFTELQTQLRHKVSELLSHSL